jgi:hypothetical protein
MPTQNIEKVEVLSQSEPMSAVQTRRGWYVLGVIPEKSRPLEDYGDAILYGPIRTFEEACAWWASYSAQRKAR